MIRTQSRNHIILERFPFPCCFCELHFPWSKVFQKKQGYFVLGRMHCFVSFQAIFILLKSASVSIQINFVFFFVLHIKGDCLSHKLCQDNTTVKYYVVSLFSSFHLALINLSKPQGMLPWQKS